MVHLGLINFMNGHATKTREDYQKKTLNVQKWTFSTLDWAFCVINTEAKRCLATHDEDIDYFNMRIYYFNRMRIYSTVQRCSITSLWHSGQHLCRAIGRLQVRISLGFWLLSKRRSL